MSMLKQETHVSSRAGMRGFLRHHLTRATSKPQTSSHKTPPRLRQPTTNTVSFSLMKCLDRDVRQHCTLTDALVRNNVNTVLFHIHLCKPLPLFPICFFCTRNQNESADFPYIISSFPISTHPRSSVQLLWQKSPLRVTELSKSPPKRCRTMLKRPRS